MYKDAVRTYSQAKKVAGASKKVLKLLIARKFLGQKKTGELFPRWGGGVPHLCPPPTCVASRRPHSDSCSMCATPGACSRLLGQIYGPLRDTAGRAESYTCIDRRYPGTYKYLSREICRLSVVCRLCLYLKREIRSRLHGRQPPLYYGPPWKVRTAPGLSPEGVPSVFLLFEVPCDVPGQGGRGRWA